MSYHLTAFSLIGLLTVAGCTGSTDPADAGLFDNIRNRQSGEYDRQIRNNNQTAAEINSDNQARQAAVNDLNRQRNANAGAISSLKRDIAAVERQIAAARTASAGNPQRLAQLNSLQSQLVAVRADADADIAPGQVQGELSRIRNAVRALSS